MSTVGYIVTCCVIACLIIVVAITGIEESE
jgi:hypothetical protein